MKGSVVEVLWGNILYGTDRGVESVVQVRLAYRGRGKERGRGERESKGLFMGGIVKDDGVWEEERSGRGETGNPGRKGRGSC